MCYGQHHEALSSAPSYHRAPSFVALAAAAAASTWTGADISVGHVWTITFVARTFMEFEDEFDTTIPDEQAENHIAAAVELGPGVAKVPARANREKNHEECRDRANGLILVAAVPENSSLESGGLEQVLLRQPSLFSNPCRVFDRQASCSLWRVFHFRGW